MSISYAPTADLNLELGRLAATDVHDLIALAIGSSGDGAQIAKRRGLRAARLRAIKADVRANLARADLSVAAVARRKTSRRAICTCYSRIARSRLRCSRSQPPMDC